MNTTQRKKLEFLGYNLGTYSGWDGDEEFCQYTDWRPSSDVKYVVPNRQGNELMIGINLVNGQVTISDFAPDEPDVVTGDWKTIATISWRELIGHQVENQVEKPCIYETRLTEGTNGAAMSLWCQTHGWNCPVRTP